MIRCYERQTYPERELFILDDAGQYQSTEGDRWHLISKKTPPRTLGESRNAVTRLVPEDVELIQVMDDDDLYLPWALEATVAALQTAPLSRPSVMLDWDGNCTLRQHRTGGLYHSGWGYRKDYFWKVAGYPVMNNGEDQGLLQRLEAIKTPTADPILLGYLPFMIYGWDRDQVWHISHKGATGYELNGSQIVPTEIERWIDDPPINLNHPQITVAVLPRKF
jgi:hypothetical protein